MSALPRRCGFVGPYVLEAIGKSTKVSEETRKCASLSFASSRVFYTQRKALCAHHVSHAPPSFVSPKTLDTISQSQAASSEAREAAHQSLLHSQAIQDARTAAEERLAAVPKPSKLVRKIYDAKGGADQPGTLIRSEGQARVTNRSVNNAYDGLGIVHEFYSTVFKRNSIDDKGMELIGTVNLNPDAQSNPLGYDNAFWDGQHMVFGAGDGEVFDDFTDGLDVIAHELTHGVTQYTAKLEYKGQSGALNESLSDVFACMIEQWWFNQTAADGDWILGQGLLSMLRRGPALRSLKAPGTAYTNDPVLGTDNQPGTMDGYVDTEEDEGGVHTNSGIPNHAFYLAATGLGGFSWDKAGHIWYGTITDPVIKSTCNFKEFATLTVKHALALYGSGAATTVRSAWTAVGIVV